MQSNPQGGDHLDRWTGLQEDTKHGKLCVLRNVSCFNHFFVQKYCGGLGGVEDLGESTFCI